LISAGRLLKQGLSFNGVVESPIYCVAAVFQTLGILHVLPRPLRLVYGTFYLAISEITNSRWVSDFC